MINMIRINKMKTSWILVTQSAVARASKVDADTYTGTRAWTWGPLDFLRPGSCASQVQQDKAGQTGQNLIHLLLHSGYPLYCASLHFRLPLILMYDPKCQRLCGHAGHRGVLSSCMLILAIFWCVFMSVFSLARSLASDQRHSISLSKLWFQDSSLVRRWCQDFGVRYTLQM